MQEMTTVPFPVHGINPNGFTGSFHTSDTRSEEDCYNLSRRRTQALQEVDNAHFS